MSVGRTIRWLLVPVVAAAVVAIVVVGGRWVVSLADARCAPENFAGGACVEPWQTGAVEAAIYTGVVLVALGLTLLPSALAPSLKRTVSIIGALLAVAPLAFIYYSTRWPEVVAPLALAAIVCVAGSGWVWLRSGGKNAT